MKKLIVFVGSLAMISCQKSENQPVGAENIAVVKQMYEHFNKHDWSAMAAMYTDTASFKDPSFGKTAVPQTQQQTAQKYKELSKTFPDLKDNIVAIYPSGNKHVVVEFVSSGTAPDGSKFELPICTIFTIENGKITQDFTYYDNTGM
jgi:steroid delta-isomerase-like uncharacterized protein